MLAHTIADVVARLNEILAWSQQHTSRLGYFPALYRKMTLRVQAGIADGFFDDGERMERIGVVFANRYLTAFEQYQGGERPSRSWLLAFEAAPRWRPIVSQHLLLGMNAHINLDLGIAVAHSVSPERLSEAQNDFNSINDLLSDLLDEVQQELAEIWPFFGLLDRLAGRHDEGLINFSLEKARDQAWRLAEHLAPLNETEQAREIDRADHLVETLGRLILHPGLLARVPLIVARLGERGTVPDIIDILT